MQERGGRQEWGAQGGHREDERCTKLKKKKTHLFEPSQEVQAPCHVVRVPPTQVRAARS